MSKKKKINTQDFFNLESPNDIERFIDKNVDIVEQVLKYLKDKNWSQKKLAKALDKRESEISKWLSGTHNLTLKTITKLESIFDKDIIKTPMKVSLCDVSFHLDLSLKKQKSESLNSLYSYESLSDVIQNNASGNNNFVIDDCDFIETNNHKVDDEKSKVNKIQFACAA